MVLKVVTGKLLRKLGLSSCLRCGIPFWSGAATRAKSRSVIQELSFAPLGLVCFLSIFPMARAMGCILTPLRGLLTRGSVQRSAVHMPHILVQNFPQEKLSVLSKI